MNNLFTGQGTSQHLYGYGQAGMAPYPDTLPAQAIIKR